MKFDIHHGAAVQTVRAAESSLRAVETEFASAVELAGQLIGALGDSPTVAAAVAAVRDQVFTPTADSAVSCTRAAAGATSTALSHYSTGDQEMAGRASASAGRVGRFDMPGVRR